MIPKRCDERLFLPPHLPYHPPPRTISLPCFTMRTAAHVARIALALLGLASLDRLPAAIPTPFNTETAAGGPMPAAMAAAQVKLPPGFRCTAFAAEPDVCQPIAMVTDSRGRLWVAENYTYAERTVNFHPDLRDRILVFEDTDNDGVFDKRTVFWEGAQRLTSIEVGFGGVWALCPPNLYFIPDKTATTCRIASPRLCSTALNSTGHATRWPTGCAGGQTAGSMDVREFWVRRGWENRTPPRTSGPR